MSTKRGFASSMSIYIVREENNMELFGGIYNMNIHRTNKKLL